jgi:hypothetical protein
VTSDGITDYVVATSSRAKALDAWGVRQDLFKDGTARETDDPALVKAASAQPGEVLRRQTGARVSLAKLKPAQPAKPAAPSKAQLKRVADLEARLDGLDAEQAAARARLAAERAALDRRQASLDARQRAERRTLEARLAAARRAPG